ncbi:MAG: hypothetical protein EXR62_10205 [Chloroflexi bacterium]|nr:hypothetical protein [Chloroflexota bacterium]
MYASLRRKKWYFLSVISLCLAACSVLQAPAPTPLPVARLKVTLSPFLSFAPFYIAEEEGYFKEQNLEIEWSKMDSTATITPLLVQGQLDILAGILNIAQVNAIARGANLKIVADKGYFPPAGCTANAVVVRPGLEQKLKPGDLSGLRGLRLNANPVNYNGYIASKLLESGGLTLKDVTLTTLTTAVIAESFNKGELDAAMLSEPDISRVLQDAHGVIYKAAQEIIPNAQFGIIMYGPSVLEKNPDAGKRFMVAYLKAVRKYNEGKTERNLDIMVKNTGLDRAVLKQSCWQPFRNDGQVNTDSVMDFQNWAVKEKQLDKPATVDQFWDPSYINYANQVLGKGGAK